MSKLVSLTDEELVLLDGKVSDKAQQKVDAAKARIAALVEFSDLTAEQSAFVADVLTWARTEGKVWWVHAWDRRCRVCGKGGGYVNYKSGPRKGTPNYDKPVTVAAIDLGWRFVQARDRTVLGACRECVEELTPVLRDALAGVRVQLPGQLVKDGATEWVRYERRRCLKCGWEGHEGEMRQLRTVMGDGTYPGGCPDCTNESRFLGAKAFDHLDGFDLVAAS